MKEVEKKDEKDVGKPDIPDVSGGLSWPDDGCVPGLPQPYPWPEPPEYPTNPGLPIDISQTHQV